jgi:hypothetical protein
VGCFHDIGIRRVLIRTQGGMEVEVTTEKEEESETVAHSIMPGGTFDTLWVTTTATSLREQRCVDAKLPYRRGPK